MNTQNITRLGQALTEYAAYFNNNKRNIGEFIRGIQSQLIDEDGWICWDAEHKTVDMLVESILEDRKHYIPLSHVKRLESFTIDDYMNDGFATLVEQDSL